MLELKNGELHIWNFNQESADVSSISLLNKEEKLRYLNYKFSKDKIRFLKSSTLLKILLSQYTGIKLDDIIISRKCKTCGKSHGKPRMLNANEINFSVSYSKNIIIIAFYKNSPIGVDIEFVDNDFLWEEVIEDALSLKELENLNRLKPFEKNNSFYTYWTLKEALTKFTERGILDNFSEIEISYSNNSYTLCKYPNFRGNLNSLLLNSMIFKSFFRLSFVIAEPYKSISFYSEEDIKKINRNN